MSVSLTLNLTRLFAVSYKKIGDFLWGLPLIVLLFGTHIYLTFKTGFVQKYICLSFVPCNNSYLGFVKTTLRQKNGTV